MPVNLGRIEVSKLSFHIPSVMICTMCNLLMLYSACGDSKHVVNVSLFHQADNLFLKEGGLVFGLKNVTFTQGELTLD